MSSQFDASDFVDSDLTSARRAPYAGAAAFSAPAATHDEGNRPPTRQEVDVKVSETQQKLVELKRAQEELERERAALEETRRRQIEFQTGREEMLTHLTRGLGLLEEGEFAARLDVEQMAKTLVDFRDALSKVQAINDQTWTKENFSTELTRSLTTIENARMEWNAARLKFPVLSGITTTGEKTTPEKSIAATLATQSFGSLCKIGFALTWPLALLGLGIFIALLVRH